MANKIKFTTEAVSGALSKGNARISVGGVSGPTHDTGFFNGITPPEGGYVIYSKKEGIVEDGLVFAIDAGNKSSYRPDLGLNKVWDMVSESEGTLLNGIQYSTLNDGIFQFDGVDDVINTTNLVSISNTISTEAWIYVVGNGTYDNRGTICYNGFYFQYYYTGAIASYWSEGYYYTPQVV